VVKKAQLPIFDCYTILPVYFLLLFDDNRYYLQLLQLLGKILQQKGAKKLKNVILT